MKNEIMECKYVVDASTLNYVLECEYNSTHSNGDYGIINLPKFFSNYKENSFTFV